MADKIFIKTFGCSNNFHESEVMAGLLQESGYIITQDPVKASLIIINICTVKGDKNPLKEIKLTHNKYPAKKLLIAGCIPKETHQRIRKVSKEISFISTHNITKITKTVNEVLGDNTIEELTPGNETKICLPKVRQNPVISIIPIASGCLSNCAYCSVKKIKGHLFSYPKEKIIEEVKKSINDGAKEIYLTAQDTGCYGEDINTSLPELLKEIINLKGNFLIRLGMANPNFVKKHLKELIEIFKHKHMYKFLHIPVQSGNDEILKDMNRNYTAEEFKTIITEFRKAIPEITIATDIIVGFPGETEEQFKDTLKLVDDIQPPVLNISRYSRRPGTKAAFKKEILSRTVKERSRELTDKFIFIAFNQHMKWKHWAGNIIIYEQGKDNTMIGRNYAYKPVIVQGSYPLGRVLKVKIIKIGKHDLRGEVI